VPRVYNAGQGFVEPINTVLRGTNEGQTPVKLVIFQLSPPEVPGAMDAPSQQGPKTDVSLKRGGVNLEIKLVDAGRHRYSDT
jgi:hypothetical protein